MPRSTSQPPVPKFAQLALAIIVILVAGYFGIDLVGTDDAVSRTDRVSIDDPKESRQPSTTQQRNTPRASIRSSEQESSATTTFGGLDELFEASRHEQSDVLVEFSATVHRLLDDDDEGSRHQRFLIRTDHRSQSLTVLVAHNIDLADRVPVSIGDAVIIRGEYEWNDRGGVVHWTHHNPARNPRHPGGWIEHKGIIYE